MRMRRKYCIPEYEAKGYPNDKLDKVRKLFSASFGGRNLSEEMIKWQMEKNPFVQLRATTLWDGDTLVAYAALTPFPAMYQGNRINSAVSGTVMVDVHYLGASIQLLNECASQNDDIEVIIGFPNRNAYPINIKYLHHHHIGDVAFWQAKSRNCTVSPQIIEFFKFTREHEIISDLIAKKHEYMKVREAEYMNWRLFQKPGYHYRAYEYRDLICRGYVVVDIYEENGERQLQIIDILADSYEVFGKLLEYCIDKAQLERCEIVKMWMTSSEYKHVLEEKGFSYGNHPFPFTVWKQDIDIDSTYLTMIDSDIF